MRSRKNTTLILVLGLLLTSFTAGIAQSPSQTDQKKATESCCCCADSCDMKMKEDAMKHDDGKMKHDMKGQKGDCCKAKMKKAEQTKNEG